MSFSNSECSFDVTCESCFACNSVLGCEYVVRDGMSASRDVMAYRYNHIATYGFLVHCYRAYHTYQSKEVLGGR